MFCLGIMECLGLGVIGGGIFLVFGECWLWLMVIFIFGFFLGVLEVGVDGCLGDDGVSGDVIGCFGDMVGDMEDVFDIVRGEDSGECLDWVDLLLLKLRLVGLVVLFVKFYIGSI